MSVPRLVTQQGSVQKCSPSGSAGRHRHSLAADLQVRHQAQELSGLGCGTVHSTAAPVIHCSICQDCFVSYRPTEQQAAVLTWKWVA